MVRLITVFVMIALFAAMTLPVAGVGPVPARACATDKGPPPPG